VFPILIETCDTLVELGALGVCHGNVLVVQTLPEKLDQVEPLARREPSQLGCEITHAAQDGERKSAGQRSAWLVWMASSRSFDTLSRL
jgi:hypothetical protein